MMVKHGDESIVPKNKKKSPTKHDQVMEPNQEGIFWSQTSFLSGRKKSLGFDVRN